ncbi:hypothetical protein ACFO26_06835 [Lactococcus nasutitermitis]|uniref:Uncharacterized protein n=1 Tax=Lactococcus nasutitermitis TaxID=1652957 RepID=A0ABV9JCZ1_9LACT|nr:hypothetical protein [Lactococcus nasutitermitis]
MAITINLSSNSYRFLAALVSGTLRAIPESTAITFTADNDGAPINITSAALSSTEPTGMSVGFSGVGTTTAVATLEVNDQLTTESGTLTFELTAGGVTSEETFTYSLVYALDLSDITANSVIAEQSVKVTETGNTYTQLNTDGISTVIKIGEVDGLGNLMPDVDRLEAFLLANGLSFYEYDANNRALAEGFIGYGNIGSTTPHGSFYVTGDVQIDGQLGMLGDIPWTSITLTGVTTATLRYCVKLNVVYLVGNGNWGNFSANVSRVVGSLPSSYLAPEFTVGAGTNPEGGNSRLSVNVTTNGAVNVTSSEAITGAYGQFSLSYPLSN